MAFLLRGKTPLGIGLLFSVVVVNLIFWVVLWTLFLVSMFLGLGPSNSFLVLVQTKANVSL